MGGNIQSCLVRNCGWWSGGQKAWHLASFLWKTCQTQDVYGESQPMYEDVPCEDLQLIRNRKRAILKLLIGEHPARIYKLIQLNFAGKACQSAAVYARPTQSRRLPVSACLCIAMQRCLTWVRKVGLSRKRGISRNGNGSGNGKGRTHSLARMQRAHGLLCRFV